MSIIKFKTPETKIEHATTPESALIVEPFKYSCDRPLCGGGCSNCLLCAHAETFLQAVAFGTATEMQAILDKCQSCGKILWEEKHKRKTIL